MSWRFKASKYENAAPIVPKFEQQIRDLSIGSYRSHGNFIAASAAFMAFNWEAYGSSLAVLPLDTKGRQNKSSVPLIHAHSDVITDFQFSPFDDGLLATGSQDSTIKLWRIPESGLTTNLSDAELTLPAQTRRVETVNFHPTADNVLATSAATSLTVWDLIRAESVFTFDNHEDEVQSVAWQNNGKLLATQCKDRKLRILDPRGNATLVGECDSHEGIKDSRVVWIGESDRVFTTGFSGDRLREITIRDLRNLQNPIKNMTLDMSSGILVPLFDPDTNMCFLCGKGDRNIQFIELSEKDPYIVEGLKYSGEQTKGSCLVPKRAMNVMQGEVNRILQLCDSSIIPITWQVPRKSYRDYHSDIYPETYGYEPSMGPDDWFAEKRNVSPRKINLDPSKRPKENLVIFQKHSLSERETSVVTASNGSNGNGTSPSETKSASSDDAEEVVDEFVKPNPRPRFINRSASNACDSKVTPKVKPRIPLKPDSCPKPVPRMTTHSQSLDESPRDVPDEGLAVLRRRPSIRDRKKLFEENIRKSQQDTKDHTSMEPLRELSRKPPQSAEEKVNDENKENKRQTKNIFLTKDQEQQQEPSQRPPQKRPASKVFGRISKFKHLKGESLHKSKHFENLKNLSRTVPAECNVVHANPDHIALPIAGPGGKLAIFETRKSGRIPDGVQPVLINKSTVMDFAWDPFDNDRLLAACDDGYLRFWRIPQGGLKDPLNEPENIFAAHSEKIQVVKFHPLAKDVVLSAAFDRTVKIWDLNDMEEPKFVLEGHEDQLFSAEWSQCGKYVATLCKDKKIRIYEPRAGSLPILVGGEIAPKKGARVVWVLNGDYLVVTGFNQQSEQHVTVYRSSDLARVHSVTLAVSPSVLIPYYDEDSNTLFLTGRGESTVTTFEVAYDAPHLFALSPYKPSGLHQGFAFLPKLICNVREVEFARAYRLTNSTIEPISFTVPRVKTAFFQDDLFPPTRALWEQTLTAADWIRGVQKDARRVDLKPDDMNSLTQAANASAPRSNGSAVKNGHAPKVAEKIPVKTSDIVRSIAEMLPEDGKLEQDNMEGVDESEWDE